MDELGLTMRAAGERIAAIARAASLSRPTIYSVLNNGHAPKWANLFAVSLAGEPAGATCPGRPHRRGNVPAATEAILPQGRIASLPPKPPQSPT
jgi:hypothetical protein